MKLTVLKWITDSLIGTTGKLIEILFRLLLLILPMGLFLLLIQMRDKASKVSNLSVYTTDNSTWQHIFPGFLLVAIDPNVAQKMYLRIKVNFQSWVNGNKYLLSFLFMTLIVALMIIKG